MSSLFFYCNKRYKVLLDINWFIFKKYEIFKTSYLKRLCQREKKIFRDVKNVGVRANFMKDIIISYNKKAIIHWYNYPIKFPDVSGNINSSIDTDILFAARIQKNKGIEDFLEVVYLLIKKFKNLKVKIVGEAYPDYLQFIFNRIKNLNLQNNIDYLGYFNSQNEMHTQMLRSKIYVLPTYFDIIPGTILEAMYLRIPVVSYSTDGIPDLNIEQETILLSPKGDIEALANNIEKLLINENLRNSLAEKAYNLVLSKYNNTSNYNRILKVYNNMMQQ